MKHILYLLILSILLFSYKNMRAQQKELENHIEITESIPVKGHTKLDSLLSLPQKSVIEYFDLSNDSIKTFPDLSGYTIKSLNMSFNQLDTLIAAYLPQKLEKLVISHNKLKKLFRMRPSAAPNLRELDVSFNYINFLSVSEPLYRIIVSHNDLSRISLNHRNIQYLDISFNPHLSNRMNIYPAKIDTIIREGIANNKLLYNPLDPPGGLIISTFRLVPTSLQSGMKQINAGAGMAYFLVESGNPNLIYVSASAKDSLSIMAQAFRHMQPQGAAAFKRLFGLVNSIIRYKHEDVLVFVVTLPEKENRGQFKGIKSDKTKIYTLDEIPFSRIKRDFKYGIKSESVNEAEARKLDLMLTHWPREQAKFLFNADVLVTYPFDLEGNVFKGKYTDCRAVAVSKDGYSFFMYFMMTKKNSKEFDSFLTDFEMTFWFNDNKKTD